MEGQTLYGFWIEVWDDADDEDADAAVRFKGVGKLTDTQAAIARVALELEENQTMSVTIEPFHADGD